MIEFCTKRRMVLSIIGLGLLTIIILILEETLTSELGPNGGGSHLQNSSQFSSSSHSPHNRLPIKSSSEANLNQAESGVDFPKPFVQNPSKEVSTAEPCWFTEDFQIEKECSPCTQFEISSRTPSACFPTRRKETLKCSITGIVYRSCSRVPSLEKRHFWIFESLMLLVTVLGLGFVKLRWSQLERKTIKQIERRLASGY